MVRFSKGFTNPLLPTQVLRTTKQFANDNSLGFVNRVCVFRKLVRLRYQDGSSMAKHLNTFQGLISQTVSLDIPLANEVLTLLLLGSLPDSWETLVVTLGTATQQKELTLDTLKSSLLHQEAWRKECESNNEHEALVIENNPNRGRRHTLGVHKITEIMLRGGQNLEVGKTSRKISHVVIVVVQITTKETVGRRRGTKRMEPITTRKMTL